jgi:hypothetical protein
MYIAASTIAPAPITPPDPVLLEDAPARIRNSPANEDESGTASAITPVVINRSRGSDGRAPSRRASRSSPVDVRRSTMPREEEEQGSGDEGVVDHLQHGAVEGGR